MGNLIENFGRLIFDEKAMKEYLSPETCDKLVRIRKEGMAMDPAIADEVAYAMKEWAIKKGATHYTHWFQPMTGITAEKHDSFLDTKDGEPILKFSSKVLVKGESDASSFPSGGMRATFEARGYTVWDPTSDAFIKDGTLCIPTAFCSYTGAVLDKKTPLLRSIEALNREALRVLRWLGEDVKYVFPTVGVEQEYFLINKEDYAKRPDLVITGRTLFGRTTPKGQILEDHYYGSLRPRVKAFMEELDEELWELGIYSKTEHNEVAPCQHEMAAIYTRSNVAADQNQLTMEIMKRVANRHGFVCLLHEKPFAGINGSGKHNNWSLSTLDGENLLKPGKNPENNLRFLLFLTAVVKAVDDYQDLLRISTATASNDIRLGGNEAPPVIMSLFLGTALDDMVKAIAEGRSYSSAARETLATHVGALLDFRRDNTDRNRTSPFAFTGDKFEFRMPGSAVNIACTNFMINTIVAESLRQFADRLEAEGTADREASVRALLKEELAAHRRILFDGNGYGSDWPEEAERRGLMNLRSTPEAYSHYDDEKNVELFRRHGILNADEIRARKNIGLTEYSKIVKIEASTMLLMTRKQILPAVVRYANEMAKGLDDKKELHFACAMEESMLRSMTGNTEKLFKNTRRLSDLLEGGPKDPLEEAFYVREELLPVMEEQRRLVDELESVTDKAIWPYPDYTDMLFYV